MQPIFLSVMTGEKNYIKYYTNITFVCFFQKK